MRQLKKPEQGTIELLHFIGQQQLHVKFYQSKANKNFTPVLQQSSTAVKQKRLKDENLVHLAGIYAITKDKMVTFTILTKEASPLFAKIHNKKNRQPIILQ